MLLYYRIIAYFLNLNLTHVVDYSFQNQQILYPFLYILLLCVDYLIKRKFRN